MHHQVVNGENVGIFVGGLGQQPKLGVVGDDFSDQHRDMSSAFDQFCLPRSPLGGICMTSPLSLTWPIFHGLPRQSQNAGLGRKFTD